MWHARFSQQNSTGKPCAFLAASFTCGVTSYVGGTKVVWASIEHAIAHYILRTERVCGDPRSDHELDNGRVLDRAPLVTACSTPGGRRSSQGHRAGEAWTGQNRWRVSSRTRLRTFEGGLREPHSRTWKVCLPGVADNHCISFSLSGRAIDSERQKRRFKSPVSSLFFFFLFFFGWCPQFRCSSLAYRRFFFPLFSYGC